MPLASDLPQFLDALHHPKREGLPDFRHLQSGFHPYFDLWAQAHADLNKCPSLTLTSTLTLFHVEHYTNQGFQSDGFYALIAHMKPRTETIERIKGVIGVITVIAMVALYQWWNYYAFKKVHPEATVRQWIWDKLR